LSGAQQSDVVVSVRRGLVVEHLVIARELVRK
jgi:hypothetical protein